MPRRPTRTFHRAPPRRQGPGYVCNRTTRPAASKRLTSRAHGFEDEDLACAASLNVGVVRWPHLNELRHVAIRFFLGGGSRDVVAAGTPFMQVSEWLGHADYVVTMTVYADWLPTQPTANTLPEPLRPAELATTNVVPLRADAG